MNTIWLPVRCVDCITHGIFNTGLFLIPHGWHKPWTTFFLAFIGKRQTCKTWIQTAEKYCSDGLQLQGRTILCYDWAVWTAYIDYKHKKMVIKFVIFWHFYEYFEKIWFYNKMAKHFHEFDYTIKNKMWESDKIWNTIMFTIIWY